MSKSSQQKPRWRPRPQGGVGGRGGCRGVPWGMSPRSSQENQPPARRQEEHAGNRPAFLKAGEHTPKLVIAGLLPYFRKKSACSFLKTFATPRSAGISWICPVMSALWLCSDKGNFRAQIFPPGHAEKAETVPNESNCLHTPACSSPASEWEPHPTCTRSYSLSWAMGRVQVRR